MAKKPETLDAKGYRKFGMRDKVAYAAGDFGCNMSFGLKGTVQTFWLVYMMLETGLLSILLLLVQAWDAINDPIIGSMIDADTRRYKRGKFKTYILIGAIGLIVGGAAVFLPFPGASQVVKAILFVVGYIIWDAAYTMANVPYGSMMSLVTEDAGERAQLSTWRSLGGMVGGMLPGILLPMLIWKDVFDENGVKLGQELLGDRVFWAALLMGGIGFIAFLFMINKITLRVDEYSVKTGEEAPKFNVIKAFGNFIKNRPAVGATLAAMGMFVGMQGAATAVTVLFQSYFHNVQFSGIVSMFSMLPIIFFTPPGPQDGHQVRQEGTGHLRCDLLHDRLRPYVCAAHDARHERRADLPGLPADQLPGHGHLLHRVLGHDGRRHRLQRVEDRQARGRYRVCAAFLLP